MINKRKNILKIAIDSPAAAGAGTQAKLISNHYNLLQLDTGRVYRYVANIKITEPAKYNYRYIKKKIDKLKIKNLQNKKLLSDKVATVASVIARDKKIRNLVHAFQLECAYNPPKKYNGSCLDGRDIGSVVVKDADIKLFITANIKTRAMRRYRELKRKNKKISYQEVLKSIKKRDKSDISRKISPLKKTSDSILLNSSNLSIRRCFLKIKKIIDRKINI
jgi:CMP/dCMP kinase|tara:strand:- start:506 stop:1165 length:660 start_codon:yes stop_codon:yes gene_type:complete